jgi:hypothetical protein
VFVSGSREVFAGKLIGVGHCVFVGDRAGVVAVSAGEGFFAEATAFVNFEQVYRDVRGVETQEFIERLAPRGGGLQRQAGDQVEADVFDSGCAEKLHGLRNIPLSVHAAGGLEFGVAEGLRAEADAVDSGGAPRRGVFRVDGFGVRFQGDFSQLAAKIRAHRVEDCREVGGIEKAGRPSAEVDRIHGFKLGNGGSWVEIYSGVERLALGDFARNSVRVGRVEASRGGTGVEVAVGAFGLAKRHLDVDA